jgi:hypothetical protein
VVQNDVLTYDDKPIVVDCWRWWSTSGFFGGKGACNNVSTPMLKSVYEWGIKSIELEAQESHT